MSQAEVLEWLLEANQPSVRYHTLTELLGRKQSDPEVVRAREQILERGWAAELLAQRTPGAGWTDGRSQYQPKFVSTHWKMLVLSDLGLTREIPAVREACEFWMRGFATTEGGLGGNSKGTPHYCVSANMAAALIRFGYADDPRVRRTLEWLVDIADPKGGWSCWGKGTGRNLDSWEALGAFSAYPSRRWTTGMRTCVERGAEFYLERELCRQGPRYGPWFRFHYPVHYYYDLLVGLGLLTSLGYGKDPRLGYALSVLRSRQRGDGRWDLDALHPDPRGGPAKAVQDHPRNRPIPWGLETPGKPSKMVTFHALRVLSRVPPA